MYHTTGRTNSGTGDVPDAGITRCNWYKCFITLLRFDCPKRPERLQYTLKKVLKSQQSTANGNCVCRGSRRRRTRTSFSWGAPVFAGRCDGGGALEGDTTTMTATTMTATVTRSTFVFRCVESFIGRVRSFCCLLLLGISRVVSIVVMSGKGSAGSRLGSVYKQMRGACPLQVRASPGLPSCE